MKKKIEFQNLSQDDVGLIYLKMMNFWYQNISVDDKKLKKEEKELKYKYIKLVTDFLYNEANIKLQ